jgi:plastocyanin
VKRILLVVLAVGLLSAGLAACGGDSSTGSTSASAESGDGDSDVDATTTTQSTGPVDQTIDVSAPENGAFAFDQKTLTAKAGTDEFDFSNPASQEHNFCIRSASGDELGCSADIAGDSTSLTVDLKPGKYVFYCGEPGHEDGGMKGTLTVT